MNEHQARLAQLTATILYPYSQWYPSTDKGDDELVERAMKVARKIIEKAENSYR